MTQFLLLGSELFYAQFCINTIKTIGDPFANGRTQTKMSVFVVFFISAASGAALISNDEFYGETFIPVCYTKTKSDKSGANTTNMIFFYLPLLACYFLSVLTAVHASVVLGTRLVGFDMRARVASLRRLQEFVFSHGIYWGLILVLYLTIVVLAEAPEFDSKENLPLRILFSVFLFLVGARSLDLVPFCYRVFMEGGLICSRPRKIQSATTLGLSKSLQKDVLHYVLFGMVSLLSGDGSEVVHNDNIVRDDPQREIKIVNPYRRGQVSARGNSVASSDLESPLIQPVVNDGDDGDEQANITQEMMNRELFVTTIGVSPFIVACVICIIVSIAMHYKLRVALFAALAMCLSVVVVVIVWQVTYRRLPERFNAVVAEYRPKLFNSLRGPKETERLIASLSASMNNERTEFKVSQGRSGAFLFLTTDHRYIVKTIEREEKKFMLLELLGDLRDYWEKNPASTIARLGGVFVLKSFGRKFYLLVMENIVPTRVDVCFDLKGSWIDRTAPQPSSGTLSYCKHCSKPFLVGAGAKCTLQRYHEPFRLLKDNDFNSSKVLLPLPFARLLKKQMVEDAKFLAQHNVMDYSLLLGVRNRLVKQVNLEEDGLAKHAATQLFEERVENDGNSYIPSAIDVRSGVGVPALLMKGPAQYHMGVIDYLQKYSFSKRFERFFKVHILRKNEEDHLFPGISSVSPDIYMERFIERVVNEVIVELRYIVQVVRNPDFAPLATLDISTADSFDKFWAIVTDSMPGASQPLFDLLPSETEEIDNEEEIVGTELNADTFAQFKDSCGVHELSYLAIKIH
eukprot:CAMPEP_0203751656 /NCGR_PEP_ID=MMETSP0098-20131031/5690_1 /ASSEMBLY_ACC=CAM_ASM_000208 /TAXON_ID=96639 /ORGANISM=" , Strain NY0313808BC1" /LENGTH=798 /DNA_ID=CAMNT_0050641477 /DNA_START=551 /DNA_END=2947 /DNA_ORIENTATION=+